MRRQRIYWSSSVWEPFFLMAYSLSLKLKAIWRIHWWALPTRFCSEKRSLIETVNDELKNIAQIEHSRHRSFNNFIANSLSAIVAYCFFEKKPAIDVNFVNDGTTCYFLILYWIHVNDSKFIINIFRNSLISWLIPASLISY